MTKTSIVIAAGTALLSGLTMTGAARSADYSSRRVVMQAHAASLDVGSKHIVSYFLAANGACSVTVLIGDKADAEGDNSSIGTRVKFDVAGGSTARTDTAEGKSLEIGCARGAATMSIRPVDLLAYCAPAK